MYGEFISASPYGSDHINAYFKVHREGHDLDRCRTQFKLVESIEQQENQMNKLVDRLQSTGVTKSTL